MVTRNEGCEAHDQVHGEGCVKGLQVRNEVIQVAVTLGATLFVGFVVKHLAKKVMVAGSLAAGMALLTQSGRKVAKVAAAGAVAGAKAAFEAAKREGGGS